LRLKQHFTYKYRSITHTKRGGGSNFEKKKHKKNPNPKPKPISFKTKAAAPPAWDFHSGDQPFYRQHPPFPHLPRPTHLFFVPTFPLPNVISFSLCPSISSPQLTSFSSITPEQICLPPPDLFLHLLIPSAMPPASTITDR